MEQEKQQRDTRQRRVVLECVRGRFDHPTAEEIYEQVHGSDQRVSKATVYRNLKVLSDAGEILHVQVPGADRYDSTAARHPHILCTRCGRVEDVPLPYSAEDDAFAARETGYVVTGHLTVFEGVCAACAAQVQSSKN